jgi:hypothetical protein
MGALSMATGKQKFYSDNENDDDDKKKRKNSASLDNPIRRQPALGRNPGGRRGRPPKNVGPRDMPPSSTTSPAGAFRTTN